MFGPATATAPPTPRRRLPDDFDDRAAEQLHQDRDAIDDAPRQAWSQSGCRRAAHDRHPAAVLLFVDLTAGETLRQDLFRPAASRARRPGVVGHAGTRLLADVAGMTGLTAGFSQVMAGCGSGGAVMTRAGSRWMWR